VSANFSRKTVWEHWNSFYRDTLVDRGESNGRSPDVMRRTRKEATNRTERLSKTEGLVSSLTGEKNEADSS
jgi:hypothetical protein